VATRSLRSETIPIHAESDLPLVRLLVRTLATEAELGALALTMIVTAASELGRNTLLHGGGGTLCGELVTDGDRRGVRLAFIDRGPGIADVALAMTPGYTTAGGMGLGLSGSKRLVHEFEIDTAVGAGTRVTVTRWT
jgi:serine/threonine-protein kinase RsbT